MSLSEKDKIAFERAYNDNGIFTYFGDVFEVLISEKAHIIKWENVVGMVGFKKDLYTIDTIGLDIFCDSNFQFTIYEETPRWFQFLHKSKIAIEEIPEHWEIDIAVPAFESKPTLVYDRQGRNLTEFIKDEYSALSPTIVERSISRIRNWFS
ncbi:hypothetical protein [Spirosoma foliorum]|uniref:Uncharacterized protein n=1 Tax=Spirosoma foliorum TaxID=2710596 RepID=A0A7G5GYF0_9BACT|nr:hypothetical protein [Spirosoma foliorum]QMW03892.1 hypothetical protein H3H32_02745 [Spirosoma foliorum]